MEIVSAEGSKTQLKPGQTRELGRAHGLDSSDKTISRRQISFFIPPFNQNHEIRVQFEVLGKNPVYVYKDNEIKVYRRFERGEMGKGDMFCVSAKNPVWYSLREVENGADSVRRNDLETELAGDLESGSGYECVEELQQEGVDISDIDPVKEFGFVVMEHEFDSYPKKMILDIKNWDWFLEVSRKDSEDEEDEGKGRRRRKRKKGTESDDDEEWTGESEDDKVVINKSKKDQRPKYMTQSKDRVETSKDRRKSKSTGGKKNRDQEDEEDEDEDDETLGGFIVDDENLEEEEIGEEDEEEEENLKMNENLILNGNL